LNNHDLSSNPMAVKSAAIEFSDLRTYPLIGELAQEDLELISPHLSSHEYFDGMILLKQGRSSEIFHILLAGTLDVYLEKDTRVSVAKLEPGHFVGEMSCLTGKAVSATVQAVGTVRTVSMPREGMLLLMDRSASFRQHMIEAMAERIRDSNDRVNEEFKRSIAVMRQLELERQLSYGPLIGSSRFMHKLHTQIEELANGNEPLCIVGEKGTGKFHVAYEIHRRSRRAEHPILSVDGESFRLDNWEVKVQAAREGTVVLEHADLLPTDLLNRLIQSSGETRILMTACSKLKVKVREVALVPLRERSDDIPELIHAFLEEAGSPDPQEAISREALYMMGVYPYLGGNIQELKRVVQDAFIVSGGRTILNKHLRFGSVREPGARPKVGVALGSGASRGSAHVGVLKALEQAGIPIDIIAGTSVGAFIGALYAGGQPISAFERVLPTVKWRQLVNITLPPKALVSNHPMARFVEKYIGPVDFGDLLIPFAAVAADAVSGEAYLFNKGRVSHAICASTAIPGFIKPYKLDNRVFVDGAVVNPVPVAVAKSMGADIVIAVDLSKPQLNEPKNFVASILNTIEIMSKKIVTDELQLADVVVRPAITANQVSFKASTYNIEMGEKATKEALELIHRKINEHS
jgi:predicted acylesterase/phospholipase RssA/CRP-like cAMP-binding protein